MNRLSIGVVKVRINRNYLTIHLQGTGYHLSTTGNQLTSDFSKSRNPQELLLLYCKWNTSINLSKASAGFFPGTGTKY